MATAKPAAPQAAVNKLSVDVLSLKGVKVSTFDLAPEVFGIEPNAQVVFDAVQVYRSNVRQATAKVKRKGEVSGSGKKPWRQKGTGRARAGAIRSIIWVGGGKYKGPTGVQNFKIEQNRSQYRLALKSVLSQKVNDKQLVVIDQFDLPTAKTKAALAAFKAIKVKFGKVLLVADKISDNVALATRNIAGLTTIGREKVNVYEVLDHGTLVVTQPALKALQEALING